MLVCVQGEERGREERGRVRIKGNILMKDENIGQGL